MNLVCRQIQRREFLDALAVVGVAVRQIRCPDSRASTGHVLFAKESAKLGECRQDRVLHDVPSFSEQPILFSRGDARRKVFERSEKAAFLGRRDSERRKRGLDVIQDDARLRKPVDEPLPHIRDLLVDVCGHGGEPLQVGFVIGDGFERRCLNELRERGVKSVVAQERDSPELVSVFRNVAFESEFEEVVVELVVGFERRSIDRMQPVEILQARFVLRFVGIG